MPITTSLDILISSLVNVPCFYAYLYQHLQQQQRLLTFMTYTCKTTEFYKEFMNQTISRQGNLVVSTKLKM